MERLIRIELTSSGWKPEALPLSYSRIKLVGIAGFEPAMGLLSRWVKSPVRRPLRSYAHVKLVRRMGLKPMTL